MSELNPFNTIDTVEGLWAFSDILSTSIEGEIEGGKSRDGWR